MIISELRKTYALLCENKKWTRLVVVGDTLQWQVVTVDDKNASTQKATAEPPTPLADPTADVYVML